MLPLAHLVTTGLGPVYDGIGHFALSPDDAIPVAAVAILAGLRGKPSGRWVIFLLPLAWLLGGLLALNSAYVPRFPVQCFSFMAIGILVASDLPLPTAAVAAICILVGAVHGFLNGVAFREAGAGNGTLELIGISVVIFVIVTLLAALVVSLKPHWARIVVRVAGSWVAAIGLLMLGWALKPAK